MNIFERVDEAGSVNEAATTGIKGGLTKLVKAVIKLAESNKEALTLEASLKNELVDKISKVTNVQSVRLHSGEKTIAIDYSDGKSYSGSVHVDIKNDSEVFVHSYDSAYSTISKYELSLVTLQGKEAATALKEKLTNIKNVIDASVKVSTIFTKYEPKFKKIFASQSSKTKHIHPTVYSLFDRDEFRALLTYDVKQLIGKEIKPTKSENDTSGARELIAMFVPYADRQHVTSGIHSNTRYKDADFIKIESVNKNCKVVIHKGDNVQTQRVDTLFIVGWLAAYTDLLETDLIEKLLKEHNV